MDTKSSPTLQALLDAAVDAIIIIDSRGNIELFNLAAERLFGYAAAQVMGRNVSMLMTDRDNAQHDAYMERYHRTGVPHIIGIGREVDARRLDGSEFPVQLSVGRISGNGPPRYVGILHDITARRRSEEQLRQVQERMTNVARLATMGEMAAGIAHEINQPLTAIAMYAQACRRLMQAAPSPAVAEPGEVAEALEQINAQALRAGEIIRRLRSLVRQQDTQRESADINQLVYELAPLLGADARLNAVRLRLELAPSLPPLTLDRIQIQQVIANLARNAIEALEDLPTERREVVIRSEIVTDDQLEVSVSDSGPGVPADFVQRMFDPFNTTKASGTGLGLSISRSIVQAHRGQLGYRPSSTGGACFYFRLPLD